MTSESSYYAIGVSLGGTEMEDLEKIVTGRVSTTPYVAAHHKANCSFCDMHLVPERERESETYSYTLRMHPHERDVVRALTCDFLMSKHSTQVCVPRRGWWGHQQPLKRDDHRRHMHHLHHTHGFNIAVCSITSRKSVSAGQLP